MPRHRREDVYLFAIAMASGYETTLKRSHSVGNQHQAFGFVNVLAHAKHPQNL